MMCPETEIYPHCSREQWAQTQSQMWNLFPPFPPKMGTQQQVSGTDLFPPQVGTMGTLSESEPLRVPVVPGNMEGHLDY